MKLKELREWADKAGLLDSKTLTAIGAQQLVGDIDRASNEVYESGVKNGKSLALLTIKADEESARQEGYQAGHAEANAALNKANEELGQQRVIIRDQETRIRELEHNRGTYTEWFSKGYEAATGKALQGCCVIWRGSVSGLATDLRALLRQEEIGILIDELTTGQTKTGAKAYAYSSKAYAYKKVEALRTETAEKLDKLHIETSERLQKINGDFAYRISTDIRSVEQKVEALRVELNKRIDGLEDFKHTHEGRIEYLEERQANPPLVRDLQRRADEHTKAINGQLERIVALESGLRDAETDRTAWENRVHERIEALEKQNHALNEWTCRLGDMLKAAVETTRAEFSGLTAPIPDGM